MGVSIALHIYNKDELLRQLEEWGAADRILAIKILEECGTFLGDSYVLLNNEFWDGYSPYFNVATLFDAAFHKEDSFDIFLNRKGVGRTEGVNSVEIDEVAERLGITIPEEKD